MQRWLGLLLMSSIMAFAIAGGALAPVAKAATPEKHSGALATPVAGTINGSPFTGTFTINHFINDKGKLFAVGTLVTSTGQNLGQATIPVTSASSGAAATSGALQPAQAGSCQILNLTLGPVDLNLLGLMVHLNQVVLTITAQPGAGNLLGNLLCAVANILNGGGPLGSIANLLNQILSILNTL